MQFRTYSPTYPYQICQMNSLKTVLEEYNNLHKKRSYLINEIYLITLKNTITRSQKTICGLLI